MDETAATLEVTWGSSSTGAESKRRKLTPWGRAVPCKEWSSQMKPVELFGNEVSIGRRSLNDVVVRHPAVSGVHCKLLRDKDLLWLVDMSTNGTCVSRKVVGKGNKIVITDGAEIILVRTNQEKISFFIHLYKKKAPKSDQASLESQYVVGSLIGSGAFAAVYKCRSRKTGRLYAVKCVSKKLFSLHMTSKRRTNMMEEASILHRLKHPGVVAVHAVYETKSEVQMVMDYMDGGDLFDFVVSRNGVRLPEDKVRDIFRQLVEVVIYLHSKSVVHRDLKPENVLLDKECTRIGLTDFGLARVVGMNTFMGTLCGTPQYLAPEVLSNKCKVTGYSRSVDVWSLGVILYFLLTGTTPFCNASVQKILACIKVGRIPYPPSIWNTVPRMAQDLVKALLDPNPLTRPTAAEVLKHKWLQQCSVPPSSIESKPRMLKRPPTSHIVPRRERSAVSEHKQAQRQAPESSSGAPPPIKLGSQQFEYESVLPAVSSPMDQSEGGLLSRIDEPMLSSETPTCGTGSALVDPVVPSQSQKGERSAYSDLAAMAMQSILQQEQTAKALASERQEHEDVDTRAKKRRGVTGPAGKGRNHKHTGLTFVASRLSVSGSKDEEAQQQQKQQEFGHLQDVKEMMEEGIDKHHSVDSALDPLAKKGRRKRGRSRA